VKRARPLPAFGAAFALVTLAALGFPHPALAAGPDPAAEAQRLLTSLDTPEARPVVQDPVTKAKAAQQRAQSARGAGDLQHGTELDALALTWAQVADDLRKTAAAEKQLADVQKAVSDLEQKAVRTQALIEQTIARRGRAEQNLKSLPATSAASPAAKPGKEPKPIAPPAAPKPAAAPAAKAKPAVKP
jgi:hypothetical protein